MLLKFWKPYGVLTKFTDAEGRATLADYIDVPQVYPIGRLDRDSEGLLLLTDDGALAHRLTDPRYAHPRTYAVQVERVPTVDALAQLTRGVVLSDGPTRPALARLLDTSPTFPEREPPIRHRLSVPTTWITLTLTEGRNRQVRRMTAAVGHPTLRLVRIAVGDVGLGGLEPGAWQALSVEEARSVRGGADRRVLNQTQQNESTGEAGRRPSPRRSRDLTAEPLSRSSGTSRSSRRGGGGSRS